MFNHWLGCDTSDLSIRSTCNLAYNAAFLAEQRLGLMLSFAGIVAADEAHHPELTFRPLQPALYLLDLEGRADIFAGCRRRACPFG